MMAIRKDSPSVSGTNRKWYIAVSANCRRDSSTTVMSGMGELLGPGGILDPPVGARGATICRTRHARYILHPCTPSVGDLAEALIRINAAPVHGAENPAVEN